MKFWDSSAIVPLVFREVSSAKLSRLFRRDPAMLVWAIAPAEIYSALARKRREGKATAAEIREHRTRLLEISRSWFAIDDLDRVVRRSYRVLDLHPLHAADALQLAAALVACDERPSALPFVCLDQPLADAAEREGFQVIGAG